MEEHYFSNKAEADNRSIIQVDNKVLSLDPHASQMEIMKGRFTLKLGDHLPIEAKIQNYAGESAAFHLHKKRDFLRRLDKQI